MTGPLPCAKIGIKPESPVMNNIYTVSRPFNDTLTFALVNQLLNEVAADYEAYYLWTAEPTWQRFVALMQFTKPLVFLAVKDHLMENSEFDWWSQTQQPGCAALLQLIDRHPDQKFVLFTSYESLGRELEHDRLTIIPFGGDIVNQHCAYADLVPVTQKKFDSDTHVMCLNRNNRDHRIVTLSYIYGLGIQTMMYKTFFTIDLLARHQSFLDRISWQFSAHHSRHRHKIINGYKKLIADTSLRDTASTIYQTGINDNKNNFDLHLRKLYANHLVEIVHETTCAAPAYMLTEKTLHSYYGSVFAIFISGQGAVAHQRQLGFDVFDDVVDHSYDNIANPMERVITAIDANVKLLTDKQFAVQKWQQCRPRFLANVDVAKQIYQWYEQRTCQKWQDFCKTQLQM